MAQGSSTRRGTSTDRHVQPSEVEAARGQSLGRRHLPALHLHLHLLDLDLGSISPLDLAGLEMRRIHRAPQPQVERLERLTPQACDLGRGEGRAGSGVGQEEAEQVEATHESLEEGRGVGLGRGGGGNGRVGVVSGEAGRAKWLGVGRQ